MRSSHVGTILLFVSLSFATEARAEEPASAPRLGGHFGLALPLFALSESSTFIGRDFVTVGLTPGITFKFGEHWALDFEFIALTEVKTTPQATTFVVDPGVLYDLGPVVLGGRVATQVGAATNVGLVPIVVVPIKLSDTFRYFVEADVPFFLRDRGTHVGASLGLQLQTGIAF